MSALLFPGQGSQVVGMGSEFFTNFELVKKIFKEADEKLNYSMITGTYKGYTTSVSEIIGREIDAQFVNYTTLTYNYTTLTYN